MGVDATGMNVFAAGDVHRPAPFVGNVFVGNVATNVWAPVVLGGPGVANGTAPHADSRDMAFDAAGNLIESDDGGVFRLTTPTAAGRTWQSLNSNLRITEVLSAAYDPLNNVIFTGNQDNGTSWQTGQPPEPVDANGDSVPEDGAARFPWANSGFLGDGNNELSIPIDTGGGPEPEQVLRLSMGNNFSSFQAHLFDAAGNDITPAGTAVVGLRRPTVAPAPPAPVRSGLDPLDAALAPRPDFKVTPYVVNAVNNTRMLIGFYSLYESSDRLATIQSIRPSALGVPAANQPMPNNFGDFYSALAYGGFKGATPHADVIYAAMGNRIFVRVAGAATPQTFQSFTIPNAGLINAIVLDPDDWETAYATDGRAVYKIVNHGQNPANDVTVVSNKLGLTGLRSLEIIKTTAGDKALLVGTPLGVYRAINPVPNVVWTEFGRGLPNAVVSDIHFADRVAPRTDVLVVGTQGRGAWTIYGDIATLAGQESVLVINGTDGIDNFLLRRNALNALMLDIYVNSPVEPTFSLPLSAVKRIEINGLGGKDSLTINSDVGAITVPDGVVFNGGSADDSLLLVGGKINSID